MIQILDTQLVKHKKKLRQFAVQFFISIIVIFFLISINLFYKLKKEREKNYSATVTKNYQIYKLFSKSPTSNIIYNDYNILGNIIIPKLNLNYPFFYGINENLLKLAPCRFYGDMPNSASNLCIAGHNYNDDRFFSNIESLNIGDIIIIENNYKQNYTYFVYKNYEITESEISSIFNFYGNYCELTLVTCNNLNKRRIVIKAKTESL